MANTPKSNETKMETVLTAWTNIAAGKSFGGMTLAQYGVVVEASRTARARIDSLTAQLTEAINDRDDADKVGLTKTQQVVNGVLADPTEGPDSALYEAMGYTRKSERKSGLTTKKKEPPKA